MGTDIISLLVRSLLMYSSCVHSRSWRDIALVHEINQPYKDGIVYLEMREINLLAVNESPSSLNRAPPSIFTNKTQTTVAPSPSPSNGPTIVPTLAPSEFPSESPSNGPTIIPTLAPSEFPSESPSYKPSDHPSEHPSAVPTIDPYPKNNGPKVNERGFFNYDESPNSEFGPANWGNIPLPYTFYWHEFGHSGNGPWKSVLSKRNYRENVCEHGHKHQSPIDVYETMVGCNETHEIRDHNGDFPLNDTRVDKRIEPNKLRIIFPRRPCPDFNNTECQFPHPPWADFPNGFKKIADVIHIDFKVPSEHWLRGEIFDGEMQVYHLHAENSRVVALSSLVRATTQGHNPYFQLVLDVFQNEYDNNQAACTQNRNAGTGNIVVPPIGTNNNTNTSMLANFTHITAWNHSTNETTWSINTNATNITTSMHNTSNNNNVTYSGRYLHGIPGAWDPYHPSLMPTIYYYRYEGSITEPPCSEFVTWFINDTPMTISTIQLEQWKRIQFTNVDPKTCYSTSVDFGQSVARPIKRPMALDRVVTRCTSLNFKPDPEHSTA
jgi:carbonic anhydrase